MIKNMREFMQRKKVDGIFHKLLVIFKYFFIYNLIPYQKDFILKLIPLDKKLIDFVLVLLQVRQHYKDTISARPTQLLKRIFPTFFLIATKLLTPNEIDILAEKLSNLLLSQFKDKVRGAFKKKAKL